MLLVVEKLQTRPFNMQTMHQLTLFVHETVLTGPLKQHFDSGTFGNAYSLTVQHIALRVKFACVLSGKYF